MGRDRNVGVSPCYFQCMQTENLILTMLCTSFPGNYLLHVCFSHDYFRDEQSVQLICPLYHGANANFYGGSNT